MAKNFRFNPNKRYNKPSYRNEEPNKKPISSITDVSGAPNKTVEPPKKPISSDNSMARAPYNFVPINISVVQATEPPSFETYSDVHFTGYIECDLQTLTPIFVGDSLTVKELEDNPGKKVQGDSDEKKRIKSNSDFFSPANKIRIPGSSLRGMVRNLVEVVSWSKFGFFEDKNLYYRSFADVSSVRDEYMETICPKDATGRSNYKMSAGYLKRDGFEYYICPAESSKGLQHRRITRDDAKSQLRSINKNYSEFEYYELPNGEHIIVSGAMPRKKDWVINSRDPKGIRIKIPEEDVESYKLDENRGRNLAKGKKVPDLIKKCDDGITYVPCFYVTWVDKKGDSRVSFGHTGMFRISYTKSIKEHIPPEHFKDEIIDFATAIFGINPDNKKNNEENNVAFSGRVFFEDAGLKNPKENPLMEKKTSKILLGPNPTSFQLYLEQDSTNKKRLRHYNSDSWIRGNKLYWHKSGEKWEREDLDTTAPPKDFDNVMRPVKPETEFKFRIRYENLSKPELGALLFALKLPEGCAHKIGMGKPIGLGSVKITPHLFTSKRKERYSNVFDGINWELGEEEQNEEEVKGFIFAFEKEILGKISSEERIRAEYLWDTYRLSQLKTLLNFEKGLDLEKKNKIEYMMLSEFRSRNVLPHASDV